jgi:glutathione reductase (NADPH)
LGQATASVNGAAPVRLGIPGEEHLATSTDFLDLDALPSRIVLVGGGYIAAEFSHIAARAGAQVTVLEFAERMLTPFDPDLVGLLMAKSRAIGIDIRTGALVEAIEKSAVGFTVHAAASDKRESFAADLVVHAAGRVPDLDALDLAVTGVERDKGRLRLNEFLQSTSNPAVYAAGDGAGSGPPLTPVASHDAKIAAASMLGGNHEKSNYLGAPSVAFTLPPQTSAPCCERGDRASKVGGGKQNAAPGPKGGPHIMNGMMGGGMAAMGIIGILIVLLFVLLIAALVTSIRR